MIWVASVLHLSVIIALSSHVHLVYWALGNNWRAGVLLVCYVLSVGWFACAWNDRRTLVYKISLYIRYLLVVQTGLNQRQLLLIKCFISGVSWDLLVRFYLVWLFQHILSIFHYNILLLLCSRTPSRFSFLGSYSHVSICVHLLMRHLLLRDSSYSWALIRHVIQINLIDIRLVILSFFSRSWIGLVWKYKLSIYVLLYESVNTVGCWLSHLILRSISGLSDGRVIIVLASLGVHSRNSHWIIST